ncbi:GNAT family N-acetyltransferase [Bacillus sp. FJAT-22090]|uniref:GNAT family N-acetyltransferase n=1 Tax=Bacillus sp. FJAT-22090 TaxID=1581038 RepID=UPI0011A9F802|nr:GNAT family N-acetyltransferase [Bacillus sp. FJAT-22090]
MYSNYLEKCEIKVATSRDTSRIIKMLKQVAGWLQDNDIKQWGFLLEGGDDVEIEQAISNRETYIVLSDDDIIATFTLLSKQSDWDKHIWGDDSTSSSLYLHRLALVPSFMKKGLGNSILIWIQNNNGSVSDYIKLDCIADNKKLNDFYNKNNFELIGFNDGHNKYQKRLRRPDQ